jgi:uncharacterized phage-associated protein
MAVARKYSEAEIQALLKFIDWMIDLSPTLDKRVDQQLQTSLEVRPMAYVTYWERKGKIEGKKELLVGQLQQKFGELPPWTLEKVEHADAPAIKNWSYAIINKNSLEEIFAS